jgi:hypothetical protein
LSEAITDLAEPGPWWRMPNILISALLILLVVAQSIFAAIPFFETKRLT